MAKSLSLNEIRRRSAQFAIEWRDSPGDERQSEQSFIRDLLQVYDITATKAALYEKRAKRSSTGGRGYIDALVPGLCAIEMKSTGKDLEAAVAQALPSATPSSLEPTPSQDARGWTTVPRSLGPAVMLGQPAAESGTAGTRPAPGSSLTTGGRDVCREI
ncbi:type IIL restriction-modification enzyme MmeI [Brachybacterium sp. SGAir0954]|uniref:type IIL restriction-modification enzyme MmeI n=1 Tax=Brachybacterium sp. SGAir0954 TaxID=2571029 RepID=UPI00197AAD23|nr:type IIL restriction-modification enzyme MmeI [Brachybacterium sp. SGAir0954]